MTAEAYMLPDGSKLLKLSETSYEQVDMLGRHMRYLHCEHVEVASTLAEQRVYGRTA